VELRDVVHGVGLEARIGINTGPIVAGEGDTLVTGDAVNVAARLEQAAGAGEILLGDDTLRLVRDAVATQALELTLKGKSGTVPAHRLQALDTRAVGVARRLERPMIGRERERARLRSDFEDVVATSSCRLFTLIGPAGIGKSRLVADFLERLDGSATVAGGRALSYGEGITYWPLVEMLVQLGVEPSEAIRSSPAETQLATRALLEERARGRPVGAPTESGGAAPTPLAHAIGLVDDDPGALTLLGRALVEQGRPVDAVFALHRAIALAPSAVPPRFWLVQAYRGAGRDDLAGEQREVLRRLDPRATTALPVR
jgi:hypothetical protein